MTKLLDMRPATAEDLDFCWTLYAATQGPYVSAFQPWEVADQARRFMHIFRADQTRILLEGDAPIGWYDSVETVDALILNQLYISPEHQRSGYGGAVIRRLIERSRLTGKPIRVSVLKSNPARRFYARYRFVRRGEDGMVYRMQRDADRSDS